MMDWMREGISNAKEMTAHDIVAAVVGTTVITGTAYAALSWVTAVWG